MIWSSTCARRSHDSTPIGELFDNLPRDTWRNFAVPQFDPVLRPEYRGRQNSWCIAAGAGDVARSSKNTGNSRNVVLVRAGPARGDPRKANQPIGATILFAIARPWRQGLSGINLGIRVVPGVGKVQGLSSRSVITIQSAASFSLNRRPFRIVALKQRFLSRQQS